MEEEKIKVYIKINDNNEVIDIGSSIFIKDLTDWILIDENVKGDKGAHAQSHYFDRPLINDNSKYNYKYENGIVKEII